MPGMVHTLRSLREQVRLLQQIPMSTWDANADLQQRLRTLEEDAADLLELAELYEPDTE